MRKQITDHRKGGREPTAERRKIMIIVAKNLGELKKIWENMTDDENDMLDSTSLPTFGGSEPSDTTGVWSWDEKNLLVGTCRSDLEIIPRT
jgi:hypothetical protein